MALLRRPQHPEWVGLFMAVGFAAVVISSSFGAILSTYDGGISSSAATFTLHGLLPYRDYWLLYGPLVGFLLAIPTAILGPSIELTRGLGFLVFCSLAVSAYPLARAWAARGPAVVIAVASVAMMPAIIGLELSAWPMAMTLALAAFYLAIRTSWSGIAIGLLLGLAFMCRLDLGAYALIGALLIRDRRAVLLGFAVVAVPVVAIAVVTTAPSALFEQLIWFPVIGTRLFRGLPGPEAVYGRSIAAMLIVPLLILPRLAIILAAVRLAATVVRRRTFTRQLGPPGLLGFVVFAGLCQLQTVARGDAYHLVQAATPAILLFAVWFPDPRPNIARFAALGLIATACLLVGILGHRLHPDVPGYDRVHVAASDWVHAATNRDERIFVGLTSHRFTMRNPLIVYYLADRAPGVRDAMFNPGVTNTDWGQTRMADDLERTKAPYLVLDRPSADDSEASNESSVPGSTLLDDYIAANYHTVCDLGILVIQERNGHARGSPPCPAVEP